MLHPLSLTYLHFKWNNMRGLYFFLLFCHTIFSATYTAYVVLVYNHICQPLKLFKNVSDYDQWQRFLTGECPVTDENMTKWDIAKALWIILLLFNIMYMVKETSKLLHKRRE